MSDSSRRQHESRRALPLTAILLCLVPLCVFAQSPGITYRQVFVPETSVESQIRGLLPLKRDEFERRLKLLNDLNDPLAGKGAVRVDEVVCRARLEGGTLCDGVAELAIVSSAAEPALVSLGACNLAVESAVWPQQGDRPALVGADPTGSLQCLVEESGKLRFGWQLAGKLAAVDLITFDMRLPPAPRCRLEIETPARMEVSADGGVILPADPAFHDLDQRLWVIELGGQSKTRLTVRTAAQQQDDGPLVMVRESASYTILGSTLDLETTLALDILKDSMTQLALHANSALHVAAVRLGDEPLAFSQEGMDFDGTTIYTVQLPLPLAGLNRTLKITAIADVPSDKPFSLPRIRVADSVYQQGQATVAAPTWLRLQTRPVTGCHQTGVVTTPPGPSFDQFEFQLHSADAAIEVSSDRDGGGLREASGTQIKVDGTQVTGVLIAELSSLGGAQFSLEALLPRRWVIDAVETQPADMLADRRTTPRGRNQQSLRLNLARPLVEGQPLRLVIRGHYRRPANNQPLNADFFHVASFPDVRDSRRLVAIRVDDAAAQLQLSGDDYLRRLDPKQLDAGDLRLFESAPGTLMFEGGPAADGMRATLAPATPRYRADIVVQALAAAGEVRQTVSIRCQPEASAVGSLLVRLVPRPAGAVAWRLAGGEEPRDIQATLLPQSEQAPEAEAAFRLTLPRPRNAPFEVLGAWSSADPLGSDVSIVWLPEASAQTDLVEVHSLDGQSLSISTDEVQSLPAPPLVAHRFTTLRGRYRYQAGRRARIRLSHAAALKAPQAAWIEELNLGSRFSADGDAEHEAALILQNRGLSELRLQAPHGISNVRMLNDEADGGSPLNVTAGREIVISLPPGRQQALIRLRYESSAPRLGWHPFLRLTAPVLQPELSVLSRRWQVTLPPDLAVNDSSSWVPAIGPGSDTLLVSDQMKVLVSNLRGSYPSAVAPLIGPAWAARIAHIWRRTRHVAPDPAFSGWRTVELNLPAGSYSTLVVYRPAVVHAWSICMAFIAFSIVATARMRPRLVTPLAGILAAIAFIVSPPLSWLCLGLSAGLLVGGIAQWVFPKAIHSSVVLTTAAPQRLAAGSGGPVACALLYLLLATPSAAWEGQQDTKVEPASTRPRVVIPVDQQQQPVGDYVFLTPEFYEALHRLEAARPAAQPSYLLEKSRYELQEAPEADGASTVMSKLSARFDCHTLAADAMVHLPLRREEVFLLEGQARLDGQPVTLAWDTNGSALSFPVARPGKHRLELTLGAVAKRIDGDTLLVLTIPPAPDTAVVLPAGVDIGVASGFDSQLADGDPTGQPAAEATASREIQLGTARRLLLRWPNARGSAARGKSLEAEQLLWWNIRPGSVVVEGRFRLEPVDNLREVLIDVDPRLRLVPSAPSGVIKRVDSTSNLVRVELADTAGEKLDLRLSWLWADVSGSGTLMLPRIAIRADRVARAWTAISSDPAFQIEGSSSAASTNSADFLRTWGDPAPPPSLVFSSPPEIPLPPLVVRPTFSLPQAKQTTDWSLSRAMASGTVYVHLEGVPKVRLEYRLAMPPRLNVTRVALTQRGTPAAMRWSQQSDGLLVVTLLEPPATEQDLVISVQSPLAAQTRRWTLPSIRLRDVTYTESVARMYRRTDVQLQLESTTGWTRKNDPTLGEYRDGWGRLVAVLHSDAPFAVTQPILLRALNDPEVSGVMLIRASEDDGDWRGTVELRLDVAGGVLDQVRLAIPDEWLEAVEFDPPAHERVIAMPGDSRRQVIIRPAQAVTDQLRVTARGPLTNSGSGVRVPDVSVLGTSPVQSLVLLDVRAGNERIDWHTTGLQSAERSALAVYPPWEALDGELFRAIAPRFDATAHVQHAAEAAPRVHLAQITAHLEPSGRLSNSARFTILPGGAREARLEMPGGSRLVQVLTDGVIAQYAQTGPRSWKVAAPTTLLPYQLTVVYDQALPVAAAGQIRLEAPQLVGMPIEQTIWSVAAEGRLTPKAGDISPLTQCTPLRVELARLEAAVQALEVISGAASGDLPAAVIADVFQRWRHTVRSSQRRLQRLKPDSRDAAAWEDRLAIAEQTIARVAQRLALGVDGQVEEADSTSNSIMADQPPTSTTHWFATGPANTLVVPRAPLASAAHEAKWAWAGLMAAASLLLWVLLSTRTVQDWLAAHAQLVLALIGFAWWLLAPFGWLGWLLVLAAIWLSFRWPWRRLAFEARSSVHRSLLAQSR